MGDKYPLFLMQLFTIYKDTKPQINKGIRIYLPMTGLSLQMIIGISLSSV